jgi:hypothetical protein
MAALAGTAIVHWRRTLGRLAWPGAWGRFAALRPAFANPVLVGAVLASLLMVGARLGGWPPNYERLPGPFQVDAFERGVDPQGVAAAGWMRTYLGPGGRVGCDSIGCSLASTYGGQDPVGYASALFTDPTWTFNDEESLQELATTYLWVDIRLSEQLPVTGGYFASDPQAGKYKAPIPRQALTKFDDLPETDRMYDNGNVRIYNMGNQ